MKLRILFFGSAATATLAALTLAAANEVWAAPDQGACNSACTGLTVNVDIDNYAFKKPILTVAPGTTVTWKNEDDDPHTVTADDKSFDSKGLAQGDTYAHTFDKPGTYPYHCSLHPHMQGTIVVKEQPS